MLVSDSWETLAFLKMPRLTFVRPGGGATCKVAWLVCELRPYCCLGGYVAFPIDVGALHLGGMYAGSGGKGGGGGEERVGGRLIAA